MRMLAAVTLLAVAPAALSAPPRPSVPRAQPAKDWGVAVTRTAAGTYLLGNPKAKVRVVEYASLTCSHCAAFSAEGWPPLKRDYIRRGLVSLELRHAVRDRADLAASLLARCKGPAGYFGAVERIFAKQAEWLPRAADADTNGAADTPAERQAVLLKVANAAGLPAIAGVAPAAAPGCIGKAGEEDLLLAMTSEAIRTRGIPGTPAFLVNDQMVSGASWDALAPAIAAALR